MIDCKPITGWEFVEEMAKLGYPIKESDNIEFSRYAIMLTLAKQIKQLEARIEEVNGARWVVTDVGDAVTWQDPKDMQNSPGNV